MKRTRSVLCWRCDGDGNLTDDDGHPRFCPTCLGMGQLAENLPSGEEQTDETESWYQTPQASTARDPQPARFTNPM